MKRDRGHLLFQAASRIQRPLRAQTLTASCLVLLVSGFWMPELQAETAPKAEESPIDLNADHLEMDPKSRTVTARGTVLISQPGMVDLQADEASYSLDKKEIQATGNIRLIRNGDLFTSEKIQLNVEKRQGAMEGAVADLKGPGGRIQAEKVQFHSENSYTLQQASYTNCDCVPGEKPAWELTAGSIDMDRVDNTLTARDVNLRLGDVPVLWVPWWQHPFMPKRQSGLLYPVMRAGGGNGFEMDLPYYWNIAPQRDATLTLHPTSRRGMLTKVQYRYMGENYKGSLDTHNIYDTVEDRHRGLTLLSHRHELGSWEIDARLAASQTRDFLNDFQQRKLVDSRERRLESRLTADRLWLRQSGYSNFQGGALWYQNLDAPNDRYTVQRLPYLILSDDRPLHALERAVNGERGDKDGRFLLHSDAKFDSFYQQSGDAAQRLDLAPELQYWRSLPIGHFSGAIGLRETAYWIQGDPTQTGIQYDSTASRESSSLRARLDLDLARTYGDGAWKHTLEPAVQYAMVSSSDQGHLPNFDSTLRHFSVSNLYAGNLYSGDDRVSSGQWVAYGLTSRLFGRQGDGAVRNLLTGTIGQRWAPENGRAYQGGNAFSDLVAGLEWFPGDHWTLSVGGRYDPYVDLLEASETYLGYADARTAVTVGYHRNTTDPKTGAMITEGTREPLEDISLQAKLRLDENWILKQQSDYSLETDGLKSWRTGVTYEHSCWSLELSGGRDLSSQTSEHGGGFIGFFFTLRGLGGYGVSS
ncbi:MAG: LPS-assembly protein LptD [Magnetococcales bacterium]|nr:LPS-assembly protein LptD [Magnetococcales bacterium]